MLENFFIPELFNFYTRHDLDPSQFWFMQGGARCHITRNPQVNMIHRLSVRGADYRREAWRTLVCSIAWPHPLRFLPLGLSQGRGLQAGATTKPCSVGDCNTRSSTRNASRFLLQSLQQLYTEEDGRAAEEGRWSHWTLLLKQLDQPNRSNGFFQSPHGRHG